jgi:RND family efflux transporter MFP subunit
MRSPRLLVPLTVGLLALAACRKPAPPPAPPPPTVQVITVAEEPYTEYNYLTGRLEAAESVEIRARTTGYLQKVLFTPGAIVKRGDPLFLIDPRPYQADLDRARAEMLRAEATAELAKVELARAEGLRQSGAIPAEEFDQRAARNRQAAADVAAARAALDAAQLNLEFTRIVSPIEGRVSRALVTVGNLVQSGQQVLTTVVSIDPLYLYVDVDETAVQRYIANSREGKLKTAREAPLPVSLGMITEPDYPHQGVVDFVENRADPTTGTMRARGVFKTWDPLITPGMFARMRAPLGPQISVILLPERAIGTDQGTRFVFVVQADDTVAYRAVEVGPSDEGRRVIKAGLRAGERVIVEGLLRVRPGVKVNARPWTSPSAPASPAETKAPGAAQAAS